MFVSFGKCSPPKKPGPISDRNCQNLYPISDQNGSKTIPFGAAHTYIPYIGEYPPPPGRTPRPNSFAKPCNAFLWVSFSSALVSSSTSSLLLPWDFRSHSGAFISYTVTECVLYFPGPTLVLVAEPISVSHQSSR